MKTLLLILLASSCMAAGPRYSYEDSRLNNEMENIYKDISSLLSGGRVTNPESYTPTFVGLGTVSNVHMYWTQIGKNVHIFGSVQAGTPTAATFTMSMPTGKAIDTAIATQTVILGYLTDLTTTGSFRALTYAMFSDGSDTGNLFFTNGVFASSVLTKGSGNNITTSDYVSIDVWVPITG